MSTENRKKIAFMQKNIYRRSVVFSIIKEAPAPLVLTDRGGRRGQGERVSWMEAVLKVSF
jgi:hypothetical protein